MEVLNDEFLVEICIHYLKGGTVPIFNFLNNKVFSRGFYEESHIETASRMVDVVETLGMNWITHLRDTADRFIHEFSQLGLTDADQNTMRQRIIAFLHCIDMECATRQHAYARQLHAVFKSKHKHKSKLAYITDVIPESLRFFIDQAMNSGPIPIPGQHANIQHI